MCNWCWRVKCEPPWQKLTSQGRFVAKQLILYTCLGALSKVQQWESSQPRISASPSVSEWCCFLSYCVLSTHGSYIHTPLWAESQRLSQSDEGIYFAEENQPGLDWRLQYSVWDAEKKTLYHISPRSTKCNAIRFILYLQRTGCYSWFDMHVLMFANINTCISNHESYNRISLLYMEQIATR